MSPRTLNRVYVAKVAWWSISSRAGRFSRDCDTHASSCSEPSDSWVLIGGEDVVAVLVILGFVLTWAWNKLLLLDEIVSETFSTGRDLGRSGVGYVGQVIDAEFIDGHFGFVTSWTWNCLLFTYQY